MDFERAWQAVRAWGPRVAGVMLFRYVCFAAMMALALWAEARPAPHLPDLLVDSLPYLAIVERYNYWLLLLAYAPIALVLLYVAPARFCRYNVASGLLSLLRGACIALTGLGPVRGADVHAGLFAGPAGGARYLRVLGATINPFGWLMHDAPSVYLTKDLFFSGHTGVTFLFLLYVWPYPPLRWPTLLGHVLVVLSVLLSHLHYTIDILGAYAIAFAVYALREGWPMRRG